MSFFASRKLRGKVLQLLHAAECEPFIAAPPGFQITITQPAQAAQNAAGNRLGAMIERRLQRFTQQPRNLGFTLRGKELCDSFTVERIRSNGESPFEDFVSL